jgi:hypothetical protein
MIYPVQNIVLDRTEASTRHIVDMVCPSHWYKVDQCTWNLMTRGKHEKQLNEVVSP